VKLGARVVLHGLCSAAGAALNGLYGTVLRRDDESGRLIVSIEGNGSHKIKADNLRVV